ncbi:protein Allo54 [Lake sturgeon herpesvirus]|nr:protein Allo54 [Lake sturgeon herpesvirus]
MGIQKQTVRRLIQSVVIDPTLNWPLQIAYLESVNNKFDIVVMDHMLVTTKFCYALDSSTPPCSDKQMCNILSQTYVNHYLKCLLKCRVLVICEDGARCSAKVSVRDSRDNSRKQNTDNRLLGYIENPTNRSTCNQAMMRLFSQSIPANKIVYFVKGSAQHRPTRLTTTDTAPALDPALTNALTELCAHGPKEIESDTLMFQVLEAFQSVHPTKTACLMSKDTDIVPIALVTAARRPQLMHLTTIALETSINAKDMDNMTFINSTTFGLRSKSVNHNQGWGKSYASAFDFLLDLDCKPTARVPLAGLSCVSNLREMYYVMVEHFPVLNTATGLSEFVHGCLLAGIRGPVFRRLLVRCVYAPTNPGIVTLIDNLSNKIPMTEKQYQILDEFEMSDCDYLSSLTGAVIEPSSVMIKSSSDSIKTTRYTRAAYSKGWIPQGAYGRFLYLFTQQQSQHIFLKIKTDQPSLCVAFAAGMILSGSDYNLSLYLLGQSQLNPLMLNPAFHEFIQKHVVCTPTEVRSTLSSIEDFKRVIESCTNICYKKTSDPLPYLRVVWKTLIFTLNGWTCNGSFYQVHWALYNDKNAYDYQQWGFVLNQENRLSFDYNADPKFLQTLSKKKKLL